MSKTQSGHKPKRWWSQDRIENLYFTFLLVSRAVALSLPHLAKFEYDTGDPSNDAEVAGLLQQLA